MAGSGFRLFQVHQDSATALNVNATTTSSGDTTVVQGTPANLKAEVSQPAADSLNATVVQGTAANLKAEVDVNLSYTYLSGGVTVKNVDGTGVVVGPLTAGKYYLKTKGESIYYLQGNNTLAVGDVLVDEATPSTSFPLDFYDSRVPIEVTGATNNYIAFKRAATASNALVWIVKHE